MRKCGLCSGVMWDYRNRYRWNLNCWWKCIRVHTIKEGRKEGRKGGREGGREGGRKERKERKKERKNERMKGIQLSLASRTCLERGILHTHTHTHTHSQTYKGGLCSQFFSATPLNSTFFFHRVGNL